MGLDISYKDLSQNLFKNIKIKIKLSINYVPRSSSTVQFLCFHMWFQNLKKKQNKTKQKKRKFQEPFCLIIYFCNLKSKNGAKSQAPANKQTKNLAN